MACLRVGPLPDAALAAAAAFHRTVLPLINPPRSGEDLTLIFPPADHSHRAWRLAAVQALAREHAPIRVNAIANGSEAAIAAVIAFLEQAEGVTGQLLELDDTGAGLVVSYSA